VSIVAITSSEPTELLSYYGKESRIPEEGAVISQLPFSWKNMAMSSPNPIPSFHAGRQIKLGAWIRSNPVDRT